MVTLSPGDLTELEDDQAAVLIADGSAVPVTAADLVAAQAEVRAK